MKLKKKDYELIHSVDFIHRKLDIKDLKETMSQFDTVDTFVRPFGKGSEAFIVVNLVTGERYSLAYCKEDWDDPDLTEMEDRLARFLKDYSYTTMSEVTFCGKNGGIYGTLDYLDKYIRIKNNQGKVQILNKERVKSYLVKLFPDNFNDLDTIILDSRLYENGTRKESRLVIEFNFPNDLYESEEEVIEAFFKYVEEHDFLFVREE